MHPQSSPLEAFGYSPAQAAFLALVARHSGYFLRRHCRAALPLDATDEVADFVPQLVDRGHVVPVRLDLQTLAYHLRARGLYRALGMPDHRNRRAHGHTAVLERLLALDVVLRYPTWRVITGETETLAFFVDERSVPPDVLPRTRYHHVRDRQAVTVRHMVADGPIFVPAPLPPFRDLIEQARCAASTFRCTPIRGWRWPSARG